jgi:hypothetical protein
MTINTSQIAALLRPGLQAITGQYPTYPEQWTEIYKTIKSDKYEEIDVEMKFLGPADIKLEGQPGAIDTMGQRITTNYIHKRISNGFSITREAIDDNLYKNQFPEQAKSLRDSLRVTKNMLGANILNQAFNSAFALGDGQPLCSQSHPIDGGVFSNAFGTGEATVDFSEAGLEQAIIQIQKFPMQSGILCQTMPKKIIIPRELQFAASRLLNSAFRTDTANNDISALYHNDYIPEGYRVNQFLDSATAWFVLTDAENGFKHFQRSPVETDTYVEYATDNVMCKATERYSFGCTNVRAVFGSPGV